MGPIDTELAVRSRTVDPVELGGRIRAARVAAALTQEQVADGRVSAAYISRIEAGNRRPDTALLTHLAQRLSTTVHHLVVGVGEDELVTLELELSHAELELRSGELDAAQHRVSAVLESEVALRPTPVRWRALTLQASIHETEGRFDGAVAVLEDLTHDQPRDALWVKNLIALCRCLRDVGDFGAAVDAGHRGIEAVSECGLDDTTEAIQLAVTVGAVHHERGDVHVAIRMLDRCVDMAEKQGSPKARASAYWNASVVRSGAGDHAGALSLARRALSLMEVSDDEGLLARLYSALAGMQIRAGHLDLDAIDHNLARADELLTAWGYTRVMRSRMSRLSAEVSIMRGDLASAQRLAEASLAVELDGSPTAALPEAHALLGRVRFERGDRAGAIRHYREAVQLLTGLGADRTVAETWLELGGLLREVGEVGAAMEAYERAAVSTGLVDHVRLRRKASAPADSRDVRDSTVT